MAYPFTVQYEDMPSDKTIQDDYMWVYLYPYNGSMESQCEPGGTAIESIKSYCEQILRNTTVDGYSIEKLKTESGSGNYFEAEWADSDTEYIGGNFLERFVKEPSKNNIPNGYGDLTDYVGCHHLVHDRDPGCNETGGRDGDGYAPYGAGGAGPEQAYNNATAAWAPICPNNTSLTKAAAVQEPSHSFLSEEYDDPWAGTITVDGVTFEDDHTLGKVYESDRRVTPMLTYHWDDNISDRGDCKSYSTDPTAETHTTTVTYCTEAATENTADNSA